MGEGREGEVVEGTGPGGSPAGPAAARPARPARRLALYALVAVAVVALDQATKALARAMLEVGVAVTLVPGVMDLKLTYNTGAAFSLGEGAGPLFVAIAAAIVVAGAVFAWREPEAPPVLVGLLGCVAGGGIGNAIDRVALGAVTDFFAPTFVDFAVFNVADAFITCGVVVAFVVWWRWDATRPDEGE